MNSMVAWWADRYKHAFFFFWFMEDEKVTCRSLFMEDEMWNFVPHVIGIKLNTIATPSN